MTSSLWEHVHGKTMTRLALWATSLFAFRHRNAERQSVRGTDQVRATAAESGDLRTLCVSMAKLFGQFLHAERAEIEIYSHASIEGFTVLWTAAHRLVEESSNQSTTVPLAIGGTRLGVLRLQRRGRPFTPGEFRKLASLAVEAAHHIKTAIRVATTLEAADAAERSRLAAQIHHGVAQYVANALMRLQLCQRYIAVDPSRAEEFLHNAQTHTQMAMDAIRATIHSLQYAEKDAPKIATLLRATTERLRSITEAEFHLDLNPVGSLSPAIEVGLAAIAGEALTNAAKHANARHIYVHLTKDKDTIGFEVSDDGSGFPHEEDHPDSRSWERFGLTLMRDQAHRLGGTIQIQRAPSGGTQVKVLLPANLRRPTLSQAAEVNAGHQSGPSGRP